MVLALGVTACAPDAPTPAAPAALDCGKGFEALSGSIASTPGIVPAPETPGEPYLFLNSEDGRVSYMITRPGAPGHPALLRQQAGGGGQQITGCPYGDAAGYDQLVAYLQSLGGARRP